MHAWIVQTGEPLPTDERVIRGMRAINLARALNDRGHAVTLWSSDFNHQEKRHRFRRDVVIRRDELLQVRLVNSIGYRRNIGLRRIADHFGLARGFSRLARHAKLPDVAFIGFPPVEIACAAVMLCRRNSVPCLLDIKDLWPDLFEDPLPELLRPVARSLLWPLHALTRRAIANCDGICAPSEGFLQWARAKGRVPKRPSDCIAPLTTTRSGVPAREASQADAYWDALGSPADGRPRATFVGSMSRSFDFDCLLRAARSERGRAWQWVLCGDGESMASIRSGASGLGNVLLPGWIDRARIDSILRRSTIGLAPYKSIQNFELNICNKVYDYLEAGLPVVSPLRGDVQLLLRREGVGRSYAPGDSAGLLEAMDSILPEGQRGSMAILAARAYRDRFEAAAVYRRLAEHLETMADKGMGGLNGRTRGNQ